VPPCHGAACRRACAGHPAVRDGPPHTRLVVQPGVGVVRLARGTRPVLTGGGAVMVGSAWVTSRERAATSLRAARLQVVPGAPTRGEAPVATWSAVVRAREAAAVSSLAQHRSRMRRWMAGAPRAAALTGRGG